MTDTLMQKEITNTIKNILQARIGIRDKTFFSFSERVASKFADLSKMVFNPRLAT